MPDGSPEVYDVEVAPFDPEIPDYYFSDWQCHKPLCYSDAVRLFERIVGRIEGPEEKKDGRWINDDEEFVAWQWFSKIVIPLPIRVILKFHPSTYTYRSNEPFGLIKEEVIYKSNHYAMEVLP